MKFFEIEKTSESKARAGVINTDHGQIQTPIFMPVGTGFFSVVLNPNNTFNLFIIGGSITVLSLVFGALFKRYNIS